MTGRLLSVCMLVGFIAISQAGVLDWNQAVPFADAGTGDPEVNFISSVASTTRIQFTEEKPGDFQIAKINYDGVLSDPPVIVSVEDGNTVSMVGVEHRYIGSEWFLVMTKSHDYESSGQQRYGFRYDTGNPGGHLVQLLIVNINDNPPDISPETSTCLIVENRVYPSSECTFIIHDNDGGTLWPFKDMEYSVTSTTSVLFGLKWVEDIDLNNARATLTVGSTGLDFEEFSVHITTLSVNDDPPDGNIGTTTYVVRVEDVADEPPIWTTPIIPQNLLEELPHEIQLNAVDGDVGIDAEIGYRLDFSDSGDGAYFSIDAFGLLSVVAIDRDILASDIFVFNVTAYELDDLTSFVSAEMFVIIKDINDNEPEIKSTLTTLEISIDEETAVQLELNITITDPDLADAGSFRIELKDDISGHGFHKNFLLIPKSGYQSSPVTISVSNPSALDFEVSHMQIITMQLVATEVLDPTNHVHVRDIVVNLNDLNDEWPEFPGAPEEGFVADIEENSKLGVDIITLLALDPDAGDVVRHSLTSQRTVMSMDELTGEITVASDTAFDYERQTTVVVQVMARDDVNHTTFVQLTVTVLDVNDVQPDLLMPPTQPTVVENSSAGVVVAAITGNDVDTTADLEFSIDWSSSFATKQGARVQDTALYMNSVEILTSFPDPLDTGNAIGTLQVKEDILDYEAYDTLTLSIVVTDTDTDAVLYPDSVSRSALLAIQLIDVNDNAPEFTVDSINAVRSVIEDALGNWLIGSVIATDADGPGFNTVTYSIATNNPLLPPNLVKIDAAKGELRVDADRKIDCDDVYKDKLDYTVKATDGEWDKYLDITIDIIDVNDNIPQHMSENFTIEILENTESGFEITQILGDDIDFTSAFHTISFFLSPSMNPQEIKDLFAIDENTGKLRVEINTAVSGGLDRDEGFSTYVIPIVLRDNYNQPDATSAISQYNESPRITIVLIDVNDNAPILEEIIGCIGNVNDDFASGGGLYPAGILATDKDEGDNAVVTFSILNVNRRPDGSDVSPTEDIFGITTTNNKGFLKTITSVKNLWGTYEVELMAKDHGPLGEELNGTGIYEVCILPMNDNAPVITFPAPGQTIRILMQQTVGGPLVDAKNVTLQNFRATDKDFGINGQVDITLEGNSLAMEYFTLIPGVEENTAQLQLRKDLIEVERVFQLQIVAKDRGTPTQSSPVTTKVVVMIRQDVEPMFKDEEQEVNPWFIENSLAANAEMPTAIDDDNFELLEGDPEWQDVYYFLIGTEVDSPGLSHFVLDPVTGVLSLSSTLDREDIAHHTLYVLATNSDVKPNVAVDPTSPSQLVVRVTVQDVNDNPPKFVSEHFLGGVLNDYVNARQITVILAKDPDLNDTVTYKILEETMEISHPSLTNVKERPFILEPAAIEGALVILNFDADDSMKGSFKFQVTAYDSLGPNPGHEDFANMTIYMITAANRVSFRFDNPKKDIEDQRIEVQGVFSDILGFNCSIDNINLNSNNGVPNENETLVSAHFIDVDVPVENTIITALVNDRQTAARLKNEFLALKTPLLFVDFSGGAVEEQNIEQLLKIILIVVSVVLGTLVILLFAAFFFKTRSLNRRLEALSTTKFGSQDSGLNRVGMSMPGANKRALEGSNPVWNEDIHAKDFDTASQGSYESGMIGIEDNPEFNIPAPQGHDNVAYSVDGRPSINPLSNAALSAPEYDEIKDTNVTFSNNDEAMQF